MVAYLLTISRYSVGIATGRARFPTFNCLWPAEWNYYYGYGRAHWIALCSRVCNVCARSDIRSPRITMNFIALVSPWLGESEALDALSSKNFETIFAFYCILEFLEGVVRAPTFEFYLFLSSGNYFFCMFYASNAFVSIWSTKNLNCA